MDDREYLSKAIRRLRKENGLTQKEVAKALCVDRSTYAYYEINRSQPSNDTVIALSRLYNVDLGEFFQKEVSSALLVSSFDGEEELAFDEKYLSQLLPVERSIIYNYRMCSRDSKQTIINFVEEERQKSRPKK